MFKAIKPGPPPIESLLAVRAWNIMVGLDWQGLEMVAAMLGVRDVESWIADLATLRDWHNKRAR